MTKNQQYDFVVQFLLKSLLMMSMALIGMVKLVIRMMAKMTMMTHNDTMNDTKSFTKRVGWR